jgi:TonB family protein
MTHFSIKPALKGVENTNFSLKERLGSGGVASVYRERIGQQDYAIKIYTDASSFETKKIEFMIANPPPGSVKEVAGIKYPRYAWPLAVVRESGPSVSPGVGYAMPVIDAKNSKTLDYFFDHNLSKNLENGDSQALSFKVEILRNLSELLEQLHELGHVFVDLKPQNVRVFEGINIVTFLDCDGFTIGEAGGAKRFQSTMVSPDYVAPEIMRRANRNGPIGVEQDEYALAVMIFQMLNNGIHPFQGVIKDSNTNAPTNDDKAAMGLYPHGIAPNPGITHRPQSVHDTWLDETRFLLDRAFVAGNKRPMATEWKQHFDKVLTQKLLVRCSGRPNDATHIHFRGKDCPACRRLQYRKAQPSPGPQASVPQNNWVAATPKSSEWKYWPVFVLVGFVILIITAFGNTTTPTEEPNATTPTEEPNATTPTEQPIATTQERSGRALPTEQQIATTQERSGWALPTEQPIATTQERSGWALPTVGQSVPKPKPEQSVPEPKAALTSAMEPRTGSPSDTTYHSTPVGTYNRFSDDDYPSASRAQQEEGITRVAYVVGVDGQVSQCEVVQTSGFQRLDDATCSIITRRFRFNPATLNGQPVPERRSQSIRWRLTEPIVEPRG